MAEHEWHKKVREETVEKLRKSKFIVYSSHTDYSKLELFRDEIKRENCLSDADIVVFDSKHEKIREIIEVETAMNPKKLIWIRNSFSRAMSDCESLPRFPIQPS